ncbi:MAG: peptide chain release factor N(5)-glutamine methyltransferase [Hyphomicrobiaceae bacterium]|nr:peptide chain release factor N(5)-glutamine methyltransferase [Hyphomicrobiaceae bacterium]
MSESEKPTFREAGSTKLTVGLALRQGTAALARAGIEGPDADMRRLTAGVLDVPPAKLLSEPERALSKAEARQLASYIARRARREPAARILGRRDFYGRSFLLSPATLDPRGDTETLVEMALDMVKEERWDPAKLRILDVGTGTGCLLLTLLCELPGATGTGTDISPAALLVARTNADRLGVGQRASWLTADALETVCGAFHILVSNPPYVRTADIARLDPEVCNFDPAIALDGGLDGLTLYRRMAREIPRVVPEGWALLEVGFDQADAVASVVSEGTAAVGCRVAELRIGRDVAGRRRCVAVKTRDGTHAQKPLGSCSSPG